MIKKKDQKYSADANVSTSTFFIHISSQAFNLQIFFNFSFMYLSIFYFYFLLICPSCQPTSFRIDLPLGIFVQVFNHLHTRLRAWGIRGELNSLRSSYSMLSYLVHYFLYEDVLSPAVLIQFQTIFM